MVEWVIVLCLLGSACDWWWCQNFVVCCVIHLFTGLIIFNIHCQKFLSLSHGYANFISPACYVKYSPISFLTFLHASPPSPPYPWDLPFHYLFICVLFSCITFVKCMLQLTTTSTNHHLTLSLHYLYTSHHPAVLSNSDLQSSIYSFAATLLYAFMKMTNLYVCCYISSYLKNYYFFYQSHIRSYCQIYYH